MGINFTKGNPSKQLFWFTLPLVLGSVFQQFYNIVDSAIVGRFVGKDELGAVGASFPVIFFMITLISGVAGGFTVVISQYFGAQKYQKVKSAITTMYFFIFVLALIVSAISIVFSKQIFSLIDLPENLITPATHYFNIYMSGLALFFAYAGTSAALRGVGDSKTPLYFMIFSTLLNILLDILFVCYWGFGVEGVGYATIIAQGAALAGITFLVHYKNVYLRLSISSLVFDFDIFKKAIKIGIPNGVQMISVSLGLIVVSCLVNGFGTEVIAAYSVAMRIESLASMPVMMYGQALATYTGQNMGAGFFHRVLKGYKVALLQSFIICTLMTLIIIFFGENLMQFFTEDSEIVRIGKEYLVIVSSFFTLFIFLFNSNGVLRGAGDTLIPMFITIFSLWLVRIPVAYFLSDFLQERGIWWSVPIGWSSGALFSTLYFFSGKWKKKGIIKHNEK